MTMLPFISNDDDEESRRPSSSLRHGRMIVIVLVLMGFLLFFSTMYEHLFLSSTYSSTSSSSTSSTTKSSSSTSSSSSATGSSSGTNGWTTITTTTSSQTTPSNYGKFKSSRSSSTLATTTTTTTSTKATTATTTVENTLSSSSSSSMLSKYCQTNGSLHQMALDMIDYSSPKGSPSLQKFLYVLQQHSYYHVNLENPRIFKPMFENIHDLLSGFRNNNNPDGASSLQPISIPQLKKKTTNLDTILWIETLGSTKLNNDNKDRLVDPRNNPISTVTSTRIIIQTEQLVALAKFLYMLQTCHEVSNCIILEFSQFNYHILKGHGYEDSVILIPLLHQQPSRLVQQVPSSSRTASTTSSSSSSSLIPLGQRSVQISFFGTMTPRRQPVVQLAIQYRQQKKLDVTASTPPQNWNIRIERSGNDTYMKEMYQQSQVCFIVHSYHDTSGGEYHRLSEIAPFGCIPIVELWMDTIGLHAYQECGKVLFVNTTNQSILPSIPIPTTTTSSSSSSSNKFELMFQASEYVIQQIYNNNNDPTTSSSRNYHDWSHVHWWNQRIRWSEILPTLFG